MAGQPSSDTEPQEGQPDVDAGPQDEQSEQQDPAEEQPQQDADAQDGDGDELPWAEFLDTLSDDQKARVKGKLGKLDGDLRTARREKRTLQQQVHRLTPKAAEHDEAVEAQKTAEQKASEINDTLKSDNEGLRKRLVESQIRVLAADRFADPDDAAAFLNPSDYLTDELEPDNDAIQDALDDLLTRKRHLAKPDPRPRPPAPTKAQGAAGNGTPSIDQQIAAARRNGDHEQARALELSKLSVHS